MAIQSKYDFVGGYENDTRAGLLSRRQPQYFSRQETVDVGLRGFRRRVGSGNLTDADGPYIELMTGVYTDNQPDFTWLQPYEEKRFTQYFMPYRELGVVKNANEDLLLNLEAGHGKAVIKVFATSGQKGVNIVLKDGAKAYYDEVKDLSVEDVFVREVDVEGASIEDLEIALYKEGRRVLDWKHEPVSGDIPDPATAAKAPEDIATCEELFMTGLHMNSIATPPIIRRIIIWRR